MNEVSARRRTQKTEIHTSCGSKRDVNEVSGLRKLKYARSVGQKRTRMRSVLGARLRKPKYVGNTHPLRVKKGHE